jgi:hypothetical protein
VEKYMIEIAKYYNVEYEPDPQVPTRLRAVFFLKKSRCKLAPTRRLGAN